MTGGYDEARRAVFSSILEGGWDVLYSVFWGLGCIAAAFLLTALCYWIFNRVPAHWLCDYGETPDPELLEKRLFFQPQGVAVSLCMGFYFIMCGYEYQDFTLFIAACLAGLALLMVTLADVEYTIIPDQFTVALLAVAAGATIYDLAVSHTLHGAWYSPLLGAAAGCGVMLLMDLLGFLLFKKEGLGFGDVKLFTAIGVLAGWPNVIIVFFLAIFLAFFHFITLMLRRRLRKNVYLPMGPYLALALMAFLAFRTPILAAIRWYFDLLML